MIKQTNICSIVLNNQLTLQLVQGDITQQHDVDVIVNAANVDLILGEGVAGAIRRKGGHTIQQDCDKKVSQNGGSFQTGQAVDTVSGDLQCKSIIHAIGPIWDDGNSNEPELLRDCIHNSLLRCDQLQYHSICFPAISTGIYGFPIQLCAQIFMDTIKQFSEQQNNLELVRIINFTEEDGKVFEHQFRQRFCQ